VENADEKKMSVSGARTAIFEAIRRSLGVRGSEQPRRDLVAERMSRHAPGIIPRRGQGEAQQQRDLFRAMVEMAAGSVEEVPYASDVPAAVSAFLRAHNLPMTMRCGNDPRISSLPWERERTLQVLTGRSDGHDLVALSHAFGAVAETGTLMLLSGPDNPTTLNFLPDTHLVVVHAGDIVGDYETLWQRLRERFGVGNMPRTVNLITGPSRSADIGQTLILGAHGPRRLHVMIVGDNP
jgi:L-lactate dehydrogenase complex protein LldG